MPLPLLLAVIVALVLLVLAIVHTVSYAVAALVIAGALVVGIALTYAGGGRRVL